MKKTPIIILILIGKALEYLPLFFEKIASSLLYYFLYLLDFLKAPPLDLEIYAYAGTQVISGFYPKILFLMPAFAFLFPIVIGLKTKDKRITKNYWLGQLVLDLLIIFIYHVECLITGWDLTPCSFGLILMLYLMATIFLVRSAGFILIVLFLWLKKKRSLRQEPNAGN